MTNLSFRKFKAQFLEKKLHNFLQHLLLSSAYTTTSPSGYDTWRFTERKCLQIGRGTQLTKNVTPVGCAGGRVNFGKVEVQILPQSRELQVFRVSLCLSARIILLHLTIFFHFFQSVWRKTPRDSTQEALP